MDDDLDFEDGIEKKGENPEKRKYKECIFAIVQCYCNQYPAPWKEVEEIVCMYSHLVQKNFLEFCEQDDGSIAKIIVPGSLDWFKKAIDSQFFSSPTVADTRGAARRECLLDMEKVKRSDATRGRPSKRSKVKLRLLPKFGTIMDTRKEVPHPKVTQSRETESAKEKKSYGKTMKMIDQLRDSSESPVRNAQSITNEMEEVKSDFANFTRRDKFLCIAKLFFTFAKQQKTDDFSRSVCTLLELLEKGSQGIKFNDNYAISWLNLAILFQEICLMALKVYRSREIDSEVSLTVINRVWEVQEFTALVISKGEITTNEALFNHFECVNNLLEASMVEYFYAVACDDYELETNFLQCFLSSESFSCSNFPEILNNAINNCQRIQSAVEFISPNFYRSFFTLLKSSWQQADIHVLKKFLESVPSKQRKCFSMSEIIYMTSGFPANQTIETVTCFFEECEYMGYFMKDLFVESEVMVIKHSNERLRQYLKVLKSQKGSKNGKIWLIAMEHFTEIYLKMIKSSKMKERVTSSEIWRDSNTILFDFQMEVFKELFQEQEEETHFSKRLNFMFEQFAKLFPYLEMNRCLEILKLVQTNEPYLNSPHYAEQISEWIWQCYNRFESLEKEFPKKAKKLTEMKTVLFQLLSTFIKYLLSEKRNMSKRSQIRHYMKTTFDLYVAELEGSEYNMLRWNFPAFYSENDIEIGKLVNVGIIYDEKDTRKAFAWYFLYKLMGKYLLIPIAKKVPIQGLHELIQNFENELKVLITTLLNTDVKNAVISLLISSIISVVYVKQSKYNCDLKLPLCDAFIRSIHNLVVSPELVDRISTLHQFSTLSKALFSNCSDFLRKCTPFETTIIDYLVESEEDVTWILNDLLQICGPGEVVPFLVSKFTRSPNESLSKKQYLEILLRCASYYPVPDSYDRSLKDSQIIECKGNLNNSVSIATWIKVPIGNKRNIFAIALGCTLKITVSEDRKNFHVSFSEVRKVLFSTTVNCQLNNFHRWFFLSISFQLVEDTLNVFVTFNDQFVEFQYTDESRQRKFSKSSKNCSVRWDLSDVFNTSVSIFNIYFKKDHVAALNSMGIQRKSCATAMRFCNVSCVSLHKFVGQEENESEVMNVLGHDTLRQLKDYELRIDEKPASQQFKTLNNFHTQFVNAGGVPAILLLYARALYAKANSSMQNNSLKLLLKMMSKPYVDYEKWSPSVIKSIIVLLLKSENTIIDFETLKIVLLHCFKVNPEKMASSIEKIPYEEESEEILNAGDLCRDFNEALVRDPELLERLISNWDLWIRKPSEFVLLVQFLAAAVESANAYNVVRLVPVLKASLRTLIAISNENINWNIDGNQLAAGFRTFFGNIVRSLEGEVKKEVALDLWSCIVLMKPASDMYVENDMISHHDWFHQESVEHETQNMPNISMRFEQEPSLLRYDENLSMDIPSDYDEDELVHRSTTSSSSNSSVSEITKSWNVAVRREIYDILIELVQMSPDDQKLNNDSLCTETLIVLLTKETDNEIIARIVSLFEKLVLHYSSVEDQFLMVKSYQFKILGAQLQRKMLGLSVSNNLFSILLHEEIDLLAGLDSIHVQNFAPDLLSCHVIDTIFVVFTESIMMSDNAEMFIHTCGALSTLFEHNSQLAQAMADRHLNIVMIDAFFNICSRETLNGKEHNPGIEYMKRSAWMQFAKKIVITGIISNDKKVYGCAVKFLELCSLAHCQETSDYRTIKSIASSEGLYQCLASLLLSGLQTLIADSDSQEHRSASAVNSPFNSRSSSLEELDFYFVNESSHRWADGLHKFKDKLRQKFQGLSPNLNCPYVSTSNHRIPSMEMTSRMKKMLSMCQRFYTVCKPPVGFCDEETSFHQIFFDNLVRITTDAMLTKENTWFSTVQSEARIHLSLLVCNTLFDYTRRISRSEVEVDEAGDRRKIRMLNKLLNAPVQKMKSTFMTNLNIETCIQTSLLEEILMRPDTDEYAKIAKEFLVKYDMPYKVHALNPEAITPDIRQLIKTEFEMTAQWCNENRKEEIRVICYHSLSWKLRIPTEEYTTIVNDITQDAVRTQGDARKIYYTAMSKHFKIEGLAKTEFQKIEKSLAHVGRLGEENSNNQLSSISAVQGPRGEKIRFDKCPALLPENFHTQIFPEIEKLSDLCDSETTINANRSVKESSLFTCDAILALNGTYYDGVLVFTDIHIYFLGLENNQNIEITYTNILTIHHRRFELKKLAFELFMENHSTWFFATKNDDDQNAALKLILERSSGKLAHPSDLQEFTKQWEAGEITNFEYIMILNTYSGRTYHDFMQYPIMPHVLASYDENFVDLCDPSSYRLLKKPIAIQNEDMEDRYKNCYSMLRESSMNDAHSAPYHFASLYSNLATVSYYLIRLLPHAKIAVEFQDGAFDCPDRIFHSVSSTFRLASGGSATDYKELVPEMFTTPEVYLNENCLNFGTCQNGEVVKDVILPNWCDLPSKEVNTFLQDRNNMKHFKADLFVISQRHALESRHVQENLHDWIDLIFGYKQTGEPAKQAINVYHPAVYPESIPPDQCEPILYAAHKANVRNIGQVPIQLFTKPHPSRTCDSESESFWNCAGIRGLSVGQQIFHHTFELKKFKTEDEIKSGSRIKNFLRRDNGRAVAKVDTEAVMPKSSSTFFPPQKDFSTIQVSFENSVLILTDTKTKQTTFKNLVREILDVWFSPECSIIACLGVFGVIDFYRMNRKNFFGHMTMECIFDGSIQSTTGGFTKFGIFPNFNVVFAISGTVSGAQFVSFWDLNEKRLIHSAKPRGKNLEIFGILKHTGELITAEKSDYLDKQASSKMFKYSVNGRLMMESTFDFGFISGDVSQMRPGQGTPMVAVICNDFSIRIIETITLTCVKYIDLTKSIQSPPKKIMYEESGNLIITDDKQKKWKLTRKQC